MTNICFTSHQKLHWRKEPSRERRIILRCQRLSNPSVFSKFWSFVPEIPLPNFLHNKYFQWADIKRFFLLLYQAAATNYIELILKESDNNVKLIVLDKLIKLKANPSHEKVLQVISLLFPRYAAIELTTPKSWTPSLITY